METAGAGIRAIMRSLQPDEIDLRSSTRGLDRESLPRVAPEPSQNVDEVEPLDTLGNDAKPERVAEVDDRADEVLIPWVAAPSWRRDVNVRSNLTSPTSSSLRCERDENPVPKSSIDTMIPASAKD